MALWTWVAPENCRRGIPVGRDKDQEEIRMKLRFLNTIATGAALVASFALAGGAVAQDKTLSVGTWYWAQPVLGDWWKMVGEKFEADNPGVKLDVRNLPVNDYMTQVVIEVASGNPADVVSASVNLAEIKDSGGIVPLNDFIERSGMRDKIEEACWTATTFDGQIMAVPIAGRTLVQLYNEAKFKEAGIAGPPKTPEEFLDAARKLTIKDASGKVTQYGASMVHINEEPSFEMLMMWSIAFGGRLTDGTNPTVTDPGVVKALTFMKTLYDEELIPRGRSEDDQRALFAAGTTAMELDGPWQVPFVAQVNPDMVSSIIATRLPWDGPATGGPNVLLSVGNTANQELAWKFIETVVSPELQQQFPKYADTVPCAVGAINDEALKAKPYLAAELAHFQEGPVRNLPAGFENVASEFQAIVLKAMTNAIQGGGDPATELANAQKELEAAFN
jgi:ABC-type glycerol-3-phosphate transport system substrate-binding protein